ncbi:MAG TPA: hypothetical protein VEU33_31885 [Archangium sp.]|nr:hypothetical protein [Archangium sp.]
MSELPKDVQLLRGAPDAPMRHLEFEWCAPGTVPPGFVDVPELSAQERAGWEQLFRELHFIASQWDGSWFALWQHSPGVPLAEAPIVRLDTEGQLQCVGATLADSLIREAEEPESLHAWFLSRGLEVARDFHDAVARCRFVPDPQGRLARLQEGEGLEATPRDTAPESPDGLLGMHGADARARAYVARIERRDSPLELSCDFAGRISTVWLKPEHLVAPLSVRGIAVGGPVEPLARLGSPTRSGKGWARWDTGDVALHIEQADGRVRQITLMYRPSLPPHLR